ncbi:hypothetical protein Y032_1154g3707 [Ancylostoma ceylanicum]|uniref:Uncharacterized protein n=1 Tax=Ancylostoma ceylanicum TaxID=53326 RepID=A0A016W742_9BILA|nr:hypothetical protein Y032_1154g3707 [Ancylostoma ceylanicum]
MPSSLLYDVFFPGTFSVWTPKNTLFRYDAFFILGIPILAKSRREEILRSLFAQKILHLVGKVVTFHSSKLLLERGNTSEPSTGDAKLFLKAVRFLDSWKCPHAQISRCMLSLADEFRRKGYWEEDTITIVRIWIDNLIAYAYNFPAISNDGFDCQLKFDEISRDQNCRRANVYLPYSLRRSVNMSEEITAMSTRSFQDLASWCAKGNYSEPDCIGKGPNQEELPLANANNSAQRTHVDKVLVIINNHPRKKGIGMLQRLYQPYFGMTIFCGSYSPMEYRDEGEFPGIIHPFNYIHVSHGELLNGYFFHYCLAKVKELRLRNVEGYFFTADDAIFHFWHRLDLNEILFPVWVNEYRVPTIWWPSRYGRRAAKRAVRLLATKYKHHKKVNKVLSCYQEGLIANGHEEEAISHIANDNGRTLSDFFYVPDKRMAYLAEAIEVFFEAGLFVELAMNKLLQTVPHNRFKIRSGHSVEGHAQKCGLLGDLIGLKFLSGHQVLLPE